MEDLIILGSGGQAIDVIDLLIKENHQFKPVGIISKNTKVKHILDVPVISHDDDDIRNLDVKYFFPAIGFGQNSDNSLRKKIYQKIKSYDFTVPKIISKNAIIKSNVKIGDGAFIQSGTIISSGVTIENNVSIGNNVTIGHNCYIYDHVTISGGCIFNGGVKIHSGAFLGLSAIVYNNVGKNAKVSPGAICMKDVPDNHIAFTNSARLIKSFNEQ